MHGFALAALATAAAVAGPLPNPHSWGKAGVTYLQYRTDAAECTYAGQTATLGEEASTYTMTTLPAGASPEDVIFYGVRDYQLHLFQLRQEVADKLQAATDACLRDRGYRPFRLTREQVRALKPLRPGSSARFGYLYGLSSDPGVLAAQGLRR